jgi:hypothetical protein
MAASGLPSKTIAAKLQLSVRTVSNHLAHAYAKFGVWPRLKTCGTELRTPRGAVSRSTGVLPGPAPASIGKPQQRGAHAAWPEDLRVAASSGR